VSAPQRIALRSVRLISTAIVLAAGARPTRAQSRTAPATIDGVVTDTGMVSLADATASILGSSVQVVTGANGRFRIVGLPAGQYILVVRHLGFAPTSTALQAAPGDTLRMSFALTRIATALDTVVVSTKRYSMRMAEFEQRRKAGIGHFMTQSEIEARNAVLAADLMRTFMSVHVVETTRGTIPMNYRGKCQFRVLLDGVASSLDNLPTPKDLAGIEVYSGPAQAPIQYKAGCGIILVWTKGGP
jgi:hypothetical protein